MHHNETKERTCRCGRKCENGNTRCQDCRRSDDEIDESLKRTFDPKHTAPMFGSPTEYEDD